MHKEGEPMAFIIKLFFRDEINKAIENTFTPGCWGLNPEHLDKNKNLSDVANTLISKIKKLNPLNWFWNTDKFASIKNEAIISALKDRASALHRKKMIDVNSMIDTMKDCEIDPLTNLNLFSEFSLTADEITQIVKKHIKKPAEKPPSIDYSKVFISTFH